MRWDLHPLLPPSLRGPEKAQAHAGELCHGAFEGWALETGGSGFKSPFRGAASLSLGPPGTGNSPYFVGRWERECRNAPTELSGLPPPTVMVTEATARITSLQQSLFCFLKWNLRIPFSFFIFKDLGTTGSAP